jgi:hypothetical protein
MSYLATNSWPRLPTFASEALESAADDPERRAILNPAPIFSRAHDRAE